MTKLNRLQSLKSRFDNIQNTFNKVERKARTRTLIQMGGLLNMIGLPQLCSIQEGDDLQSDLSAMDKSATLLGLLADFYAALPPTLSQEKLVLYKEKGIKIMKSHGLKQIRT